jgi:hypothetical protein
MPRAGAVAPTRVQPPGAPRRRSCRGGGRALRREWLPGGSFEVESRSGGPARSPVRRPPVRRVRSSEPARSEPARRRSQGGRQRIRRDRPRVPAGLAAHPAPPPPARPASRSSRAVVLPSCAAGSDPARPPRPVPRHRSRCGRPLERHPRPDPVQHWTRSGEERGVRREAAPGRLGRWRLHASPSPGRWGRPGTRTTGSTPPGGRAPAAQGEPPRSTGAGDPGS